MTRYLLIGLFSCVALFAVGLALLMFKLTKPVDLTNKPEVLIVERGATLKSLSRSLQEQGYFADAWVVEYAGRFLFPGASLKAGEYALEPQMRIKEVLALLRSGKVIRHNIQFIEGWRFEDMRALLQRSSLLESTLADMAEPDLLALMGSEHSSLEGLFFPDTYSYQRGDKDVDLLRRAYAKMQAELVRAWSQRAENCAVATPYEALILASIIEKETGAPEERRQISGVFSNRLRIGMRLQTDPTVIYGLGDQYQGNLTRAHLKEPTPYNTYLNSGLPPTPIAMPGWEALIAAVQPESTKALYFVAKGDGTHEFSESLEQHNQAVRQYQLNPAVNYRSTKMPVPAEP